MGGLSPTGRIIIWLYYCSLLSGFYYARDCGFIMKLNLSPETTETIINKAIEGSKLLSLATVQSAGSRRDQDVYHLDSESPAGLHLSGDKTVSNDTLSRITIALEPLYKDLAFSDKEFADGSALVTALMERLPNAIGAGIDELALYGPKNPDGAKASVPNMSSVTDNLNAAEPTVLNGTLAPYIATQDAVSNNGDDFDGWLLDRKAQSDLRTAYLANNSGLSIAQQGIDDGFNLLGSPAFFRKGITRANSVDGKYAGFAGPFKNLIVSIGGQIELNTYDPRVSYALHKSNQFVVSAMLFVGVQVVPNTKFVALAPKA